MKQKVLHQLDQLNGQLHDLFEEVAPYSHEQLNKAPGPEKWSAIDVMHHLMLAEGASVGYIKRKLSHNPTVRKKSLGSAWRAFVVSTYLKSPFKVKAPDVVAQHHFPESDTLGNVQEKWLEIRTELRAYLEELDEDWFAKEVYKHPLGGRMGLDGMLSFFKAHFDRHHKQIRNALNSQKTSDSTR